MRIDFLFNHEANHQIAHTMPIAASLASRGMEVEVLASSLAQQAAAQAIVPPALPHNPVLFTLLSPGPLAQAADTLLRHISPFRRLAVLRHNLPALAAFYALVVPETTHHAAAHPLRPAQTQADLPAARRRRRRCRLRRCHQALRPLVLLPGEKVAADQRTVLAEPWHLSYPVVFEADGEAWMLPEAYRSGTLTLYRATNFPRHWQPTCTIPLDGPAIDATPLFHDGKWWLFYASSRHKLHRRSHLHVAFAGRLTGPLRLHPSNPVRVDTASTRPGGTARVQDGTIILPVQDCRTTYGGALRELVIHRLTETEFKATDRPCLSPSPGWRPTAAACTPCPPPAR